jgi:hypothetical protein
MFADKFEGHSSLPFGDPLTYPKGFSEAIRRAFPPRNNLCPSRRATLWEDFTEPTARDSITTVGEGSEHAFAYKQASQRISECRLLQFRRYHRRDLFSNHGDGNVEIGKISVRCVVEKLAGKRGHDRHHRPRS